MYQTINMMDFSALNFENNHGGLKSLNDHSVASDPNWIRIELNGFVTWETRFVCGQPGKRVNVTTGVNMTNFRSKQTTNHDMTERN